MHRFACLALLLFAPLGLGAAEAAPSDSLTAREIAFEMRYGLSETSSSVALQSGGRTDLQLHTLVSMTWTIGVYYGSTEAVGWPHRTSLGIATGSSLALGLLKEIYDRSKIGNRFSGADMLMNFIGTGIGAGIVIGLRG